jgi:amino acid transporter
MSSSSKVFVREATGLVREVSAFSAFANNAGSTGIAFSLAIYMWGIGFLSGANVQLAILISVIFSTIHLVTFALMNASMPRSGGDYVWVSRTLHPAVGLMGNFTMYYSQINWLPLSTTMTVNFFLATSFATIGFVNNDPGAVQLGVVLAQPWAAFTVGAIVITVIAAISISGLRNYLRMQNVLFLIGVLAAIPMIAVLVSTSTPTFVEAWNRGMAASIGVPDPYSFTIKSARDLGFDPTGFSWFATLAAVPAMYATLAYTFFSSYYGGEIKGAASVKRQMAIMWLCMIFIAGIVALIGFLMENMAGHEFLASIFWLWANSPSTLGSVPVAPYFNLFVLMVTQNVVVQYIIIAGFVAWGFIMPVILYMYCTRCLFAWSFDRIFPAWLSDVSDRFHTPLKAILAITGFSYIMLAVYTVLAPIAGVYVFQGTIVNQYIITFIPAGIAAILFPFWRKELYNASPARKYKIGSIPLVSLGGVGLIVIMIIMAWLLLTIPPLGVVTAPFSLVPFAYFTVIGLPIIALVIYYIAKAYRRQQGMDLSLIFREIPPE